MAAFDYGEQYQFMVNSILNYYSSGSDFWQRVYTGNASSYEIYDAFSKMQKIVPDTSISGKNLGWKVEFAEPLQPNNAVYDIIDSVNSNNHGGTYSDTFVPNYPANFGYDSQAGQYFIKSGSSGTGGLTLSTIADRASLAVTGVNIGCKLGKLIDQGLYNLAPEWWDEHLPTINPETWSSLCGQSEVGDFFLRTLLDVTPNNTTGYVNEEVLAYYYQMMRDNGFFDPGTLEAEYTGSTTQFPLPDITSLPVYSLSEIIYTGSRERYEITSHTQPVYQYITRHSRGYIMVYTVSKAPFSYTLASASGYTWSGTTPNQGFRTYNGNLFYYLSDATDYYGTPPGIVPDSWKNLTVEQVGTIILDGGIYEESVVPGVSNLDDSTQYPPTNITGTTTQQVLQQLKQEYPDLFTDSITETTMQEDGTLDETIYVPIPWVTQDFTSDTATTIDGATQEDYNIDPETMYKTLKKTPDPTTPDTGEGSSNVPVLPTGNASSLWAVYNPTQGELNSFGAWLWSSNFVEQIKRLFVDPMQAIIGVHKVFAPVSTGGNQTIKAGYLDSGVSSAVVSSQYTSIDCGTVSVNEFYGNVFDYEPYTTIHAYLPFIGVVQLSTADVMRSKVNITYGVDVITGACLAKIKITRDGNGGILYSYGGSCAVHYPVSSGSYSGIISGLISAAVGVGTSIATGNPLAAVGGVVSGIHQAKLDVTKSGGFTGASGATGPKIPYLIISRPQTAMAIGFDVMTGYPANQLVQIKDCEGYIKCKETHIESNTATQEELNTIEMMLKNGILI